MNAKLMTDKINNLQLFCFHSRITMRIEIYTFTAHSNENSDLKTQKKHNLIGGIMN